MAVTHADELELDRIEVPGDISSAAFAIAAALIVRRSSIRLERIGVNWTRTGFLRIVERMGAVVVGDLEPVADPSAPVPAAEPASDIEVRHGALSGTVVEADEVPLAIDELPLVALLGCFAEGETVVRGAAELRVKESDRITVVVDGLRGLGADIEATEDGFVVQGTGGLRGGQIESRGDHRIAMLGAVAGLAAREGVEVVGMDAAAVSYPRFVEDISRALERLMFVAIDGPAGVGKSTVARAVARELGFAYLDTGAMYRCVGLASLGAPDTPPGQLAERAGIDFDGERVLLDGSDVSREIRVPEVGEAASKVAADPRVRAALVERQRELIATHDGVAEGRDIGTVVAPGAEVKVFLTAAPRERARRRADELGADVETVLADQTLRDQRDAERAASPLRAAEDAIEIDTTDLTVEQVVERVVGLVAARRGEDENR